MTGDSGSYQIEGVAVVDLSKYMVQCWYPPRKRSTISLSRCLASMALFIKKIFDRGSALPTSSANPALGGTTVCELILTISLK